MEIEVNTDKFMALAAAVEAGIQINSSYAHKCMDKLRPSLVWTGRLIDTSLPESCDVLSRGSYGAAVEAVSLVSFGLIRPAMLSLRSYYELSLQYLYYRDHPVEWRSVTQFRTRPILPATAKNYLRDNFPNFDSRFNTLLGVKTRNNKDCYDVLSGIAHGTAINSISTAIEPAELLESENVVSQSVDIFKDVGEHTCDVFVASFEGNWLSIPEETRSDLRARFAGKEPRAELSF